MIPQSCFPSFRDRAMRLVLAVSALMLLATTPPAAAEDVTIIQRNKAFSVAEVSAKVGDRLRFVNADTVAHNLYSVTPGFEFEILAQAPGRSDAVGIRAPGALIVECAIHPGMKLRVNVAR